ncbi:methyltransferase domain-containing protein [Candidatus Woesebacteria bacterium]|nr:methyltransferase domain-containing protein [Candidatus Woesebacteria bacterium]
MKKNNPLKFIYWPFLATRAKYLAQLISPHVKSLKNGLDVGAGNMLISKYISLNSKVKINGLDVIDMNLTDLPHAIFDGQKIPFKNDFYDFSMLIGVLHHIEKQDVILKEVKRISKKRIIIFEDTYKSNIEKQWVKLRDVLGNIPEELSMNFALNFNSEKEWENKFKKIGLKIVYKKSFFNFLRFTHHTLYVLKK